MPTGMLYQCDSQHSPHLGLLQRTPLAGPRIFFLRVPKPPTNCWNSWPSYMCERPASSKHCSKEGRVTGKMAPTRAGAACNETSHADGGISIELLTPNPLSFTERDACFHVLSFLTTCHIGQITQGEAQDIVWGFGSLQGRGHCRIGVTLVG